MSVSPGAYPDLAISSEDQADVIDDNDPTEVTRNDTYSTSMRDAAGARAKWLYFLLGCAILLPWNVLVNGSPFFLSRLAKSPFYPAFGSYMSSVYTLTKLVFQFYSTVTSKQSSPSRRISASIVIMIFLVMSLCSSTFIRSTALAFFWFVLFVTVSLATAAAYLCTAVYARAALFGPSCMQTVLSGHAAVAVVTSMAEVASSLISLWTLSPWPALKGATGLQASDKDNQAEETAARIFFSVSALFLVATLITYTQWAKVSAHESGPGAPQQCRQVEDADELTQLLTDGRRDSPMEAGSPGYQIFMRNLSYMFSIAYSFTVTLGVFPAITIRVQPVNPGFHPMLFTALHFLVFNVGDLAGRCCFSSTQLAFWSPKKILAVSLIRTLFIPLVLVCNIPRHAPSPLMLPTIYSDILFMFIVLSLGYTQGAVLTLATVGASSLKHNPTLQGVHKGVEVAGMLCGTLGIIGLAVGSLCSFAVQAMT